MRLHLQGQTEWDKVVVWLYILIQRPVVRLKQIMGSRKCKLSSVVEFKFQWMERKDFFKFQFYITFKKSYLYHLTCFTVTWTGAPVTNQCRLAHIVCCNCHYGIDQVVMKLYLRISTNVLFDPSPYKRWSWFKSEDCVLQTWLDWHG